MTAKRAAPAPLSACDEPLAGRYDVALLDLDGVVYVGPDPVPDAPDNLRKAAKEGLRIGYITNNASRPASVVAEHLASFGLDVIADDVVTSAQAAAKLIANDFPAGSPVLVVGGEGLTAALEEYGLRPVRSSDARPVAVAQGFHPDVSWVMLADGAHAINEGAKWYATNLDLTIPTAGGMAPGNGTLVQAIRAAVEVDPVVAGKPEPPLLETSIERLKAERPLMIGDRLDSDIAGAHAVGIASLWVATGVHDAHDLARAPKDQRPTYIAADLGALAQKQPGVKVDGGKHTCAGWTAEVVSGSVAIKGEGEPYDGLRAILSAVWAAVDEPPKPAKTAAKAAGRGRRPLPKPGPALGSIAIDTALHRVGLDK
ncbi:HAD-superfamily hydrolase, subfamily IIA [Kribbella flavida DSM 17836]|uniref:HAD-superfamily hydrolase, subfamily IIA n=1 Tax=Kribbella flavida (strain DSM 17836 / JCM 10339 / NBRC 14399) TaxID=479435 RepID=D2PM68_KRIFD|nr:HAD-IIA family hydrolase [Kribbella flavida]ADB34436.1 HAD-superfamily hydrolase, subfamily IIA [Kribbella flavida DSM 17836]